MPDHRLPPVTRHREPPEGTAGGRPPSARPLGEILVGRGAIRGDALRAALRHQRRDSRLLGEILVEAGAREADVVAGLAEQQGFITVDLDDVVPEDEALFTLDAATARRLGALPFRVDDSGRVHFAVANPADDVLASALLEACGKPVVLQIAGRRAIDAALDRYYSVLEKVDRAVGRAVVEREASAPPSAAIPLRADAPVVQIVDLLMAQALRDRASDVHIEPQADRLRIRFRIDGALHDVNALPIDLIGPVSSRLKIMANMDIVDRHRSQDGQIAVTIDGRPVDVRVATMETVWGEKVVLRLLDRSRSLVPLGELGLNDDARDRLRRLIDSPYGLLVVGGPTGAGKTTTLYAALNELDRMSKNITTIEDPVEYRFANINQVQINRLAGTTFANGLKAILRQDPDVILVGEVRDAETAQIAIQSALTGHLVLCSLHAADAIGALYRFIDMGIEPFLVASALIGVVAQRLVRVICERCGTSGRPRPEEAEFYRSVMGRSSAPRMAKIVGCMRCGQTGFFGRVGVFESLYVDDDMRELVVARAHHSELRELAVRAGMRTLQQAGCDIAESGRTTLTEVMRTVYTI